MSVIAQWYPGGGRLGIFHKMMLHAAMTSATNPMAQIVAMPTIHANRVARTIEAAKLKRRLPTVYVHSIPGA